jgi:DNA-binding NarL/FixJ family response regulator
LAQIALHRGDEATTEEHVAIAEQHLTTGRAQFGFEQSMIAKARLAERRGDPTSALQVLCDTWDVYGGIGVLAGRQALGPDLVRLASAAGDRARVEDVVTELEHGADTAALPAFRAFASLAAAWRDGDPDAGADAAELMATTGRRPTTAAMLADAASLLRTAARVKEADAAARRAVELYRECGADADAATVSATIAGKRVRLRDRPRSGFESLTRTERRVAELVADGLSNREIAAQLVVSRRTVETHVSAAYRKLEVETRVDLAKVVLAHR